MAWKMALKSTVKYLEEDLEPKEIISKLISEGVMDFDNLEELEAETTRKGRVRLFLRILQGKGEGAFRTFLQVLEKQPYHSELVKVVSSHENCFKGPIPLCIPNNWKFSGGVLACKDASLRGDLTLCTEGLELLRSIGDYPVAVISVTGPTRSGKSTLMSKLVEGLKFEVGCSPESKTTGIWVAVNPRPVEIEGVTAKIVLLDAEGSDSLLKVDRDTEDGWDMKVFVVCYFLSSLMVYNSFSVPNKSDLQRLHFIAELSASSFNTSDNNSPNMFSDCTPMFMWLLRNVTIKVRNNDWKAYLEENVLSKGSSSSDDTRTLTNAIRNLFSSFDAAALPPPSVDPDVCADLDNPKYERDLERFSNEFEKVNCKIHSNCKLKRISQKQVTGKDLADLLGIYISQVNENGNHLTGNPWSNTLSLWTQKLLDIARKELHSKCEKIELPCGSEILQKKYADIANESRSSFQKSFMPSNSDEDQRNLEKFEHIIRQQESDISKKNEVKSEEFCKAKAKSIVAKHYRLNDPNLSRQDAEKQTKILEKKRKDILDEFCRETNGFPKAEEILNDFVVDLDNEIEALKRIAIVNTISSEVKSSIEGILPCDENVLEDNVKSIWEDQKERHTREITPKLNALEKEAFEGLLKKSFSELMESMCNLNKDLSLKYCNEIIQKIMAIFNGWEEGTKIESKAELEEKYKNLALGPCAQRVYLENKKKLHKARRKAKAAQRCNIKYWLRRLCCEM